MGLHPGHRQSLRVEQAQLHEHTGLVPVDVFMGELVTADRARYRAKLPNVLDVFNSRWPT
ncbi:hypothetical protein A5724_28445 [Mycobacterium sp. ACS1612]|nr:hypothetical protein A5724_28445 [Mycobacterium sp. ACS1612]